MPAGVLAALAALVAAAGCGSPAEPSSSYSATPPGSASATPTAEPTSGPTTDPAQTTESGDLHFTVDGTGPYMLGTTLTSLRQANQVTGAGTGDELCPAATTALGTGDYSEVRLFFKSDKIYLLQSRATSIPTPSGAWLGTTLSELKVIYRQIAGEDIIHGTDRWFLVSTISGRGILFQLDSARRVVSMVAGETFFLRNAARTGNFC